MHESQVTLQGWVGTSVEHRVVRGNVTCASFRLGCTPRYYKNGEWVNGETSWFTVNAWRQLGENVATSVKQGDAVVVQGRVRTDVWQKDDESPKSVSWVVDANVVGHDLNRGSSSFLKSTRRGAVDPVDDDDFKAALHETDPGGPQLDSDGQVVEPAA